MSGKTILVAAFLAAMIFQPAPPAGCLDINGTFGLGNIGFAVDRAAADTTYTGTPLFWDGSITLSQNISDTFYIEGGFIRDPILRNYASTLLQYRTDYVTVGMGALLGMFNSWTPLVKSGVSIYFRLEVPGAIFLSFRSDNSLRGSLFDTGDYTQSNSALSLGFSVLNAICTLGLDYKEFAVNSSGVIVIDSLTDYSLLVEMFKKNIPFRLSLSFSYQYLLKNYTDGLTNPAAGLNSLIAGLRMDFIFSRSFSLFLDSENALYSWGAGQLTGVSILPFAPYLFRAHAGFTISLGAPAGAPPTEEPAAAAADTTAGH